MIVVSDTSPLNYLLLIGQQDLLPRLFLSVYAPPEVLVEMQHPKAPVNVRAWAASPPTWLRVQAPAAALCDTRLGKGEAAAISLARELHAAAILVDDAQARLFAEEHGLTVRGTLAVLDLAGEQGIVDPLPLLDLLKATSFRAAQERWDFLRAKYGKP